MKIPASAVGTRTGIAVVADPVESGTDDSLLQALFGSADGDAPPPPKNLPALRAQYTAAGLSGLRVVAVPGVRGDDILAAFNGDQTDLSEDEVAAIQAQVKVAQELPAVALAGGAAIDVRPTR